MAKRFYKYSYPIISEDEIYFHYGLRSSNKPIPITKIHATLWPDLLKFLTDEGHEPTSKTVPMKVYKKWIRKLDNEGLDYPIRVTPSSK